MFFLGEIEHRFGSVDSFSRFYRVSAQSRDSAWRILDKLAGADSISPYPSAENPLKGSYVGDAGHLVIVDAIVELDAQAFHSKALERFPLHSDGSAEPPEVFPEYVKDVARCLGRSLTNRGVEVEQSVLLHAISASIGETDWQKLRTKYKHQGIPAATSGSATKVATNGDERECEYCGGSGHVHSIDGEWRGVCICEAAVTNAVAFLGAREVAVVDENDEGLFVDIVYGENGSPLKRGDLLYTRPAASRVETPLANEQILERARHHAIDHEYWSPERCIAFAQDVLASSGKITKKMQDEIERLYVMAEGAYGLGGERHMQVTLADMAERLLNLQDAMSKSPSEKRTEEKPQVAEDFFVAARRLAAKVTPGAHTLVLADEAVTPGNSGYLAGFVSTHTRRPTFLFQARNESESAGCGRTVPGFNLKDALERVQTRHPEIFIRVGGHEAAMGCVLKAGTLDVFAKTFEAVAQDMRRETR